MVDFLTVYINCDLLLGNIHQPDNVYTKCDLFLGNVHPPDNVCRLKSISQQSASTQLSISQHSKQLKLHRLPAPGLSPIYGCVCFILRNVT